MYAIPVLGARCTGKTTLAARCMGASLRESTHQSMHQSTPYAVRDKNIAFDTLVPDTNKAVVLDPKTQDSMFLAQELARHSVPACLVTLPRDAAMESRDSAVRWAKFAREYCPFARLAVVVTKTETTNPDAMPPHAFNSLTLAVMESSEAERLFFTNAATKPPSGIRDWLFDVINHSQNHAHRGIHLDDLGAHSMNAARAGNKHSFKLKPRDGCGDQRTCDSCTVT